MRNMPLQGLACSWLLSWLGKLLPLLVFTRHSIIIVKIVGWLVNSYRIMNMVTVFFFFLINNMVPG